MEIVGLGRDWRLFFVMEKRGLSEHFGWKKRWHGMCVDLVKRWVI